MESSDLGGEQISGNGKGRYLGLLTDLWHKSGNKDAELGRALSGYKQRAVTEK